MVGERLEAHLADAGFPPDRLYPVPGSVQAITPLVTQLLTEIEKEIKTGSVEEVLVCNNRPLSGAVYEPACQCILPVDEHAGRRRGPEPWPGNRLPQVIDQGMETLQAFVGEYLFVSLFKACAESLASENAARLAAMQGAEKNIKELLESLNLRYHHLRQNSIDEELFDVIAGAESPED